MADNKLEQMLEKLVNNDRTGADELFHEFVIEKSRGIYEKMLETDLEDLDEVKDEEVDESSDDEETNEASDEEVDESSDDEETNEATDEEVDESDEDLDEATDEEVDENFGEFTPEADPMGGDAGDAMMKDIEADGDEGDMDDKMDGDEEEIEDRVVDLEDALDDLKNEFEKMMSGEKDGEEGDEEDEDAADMPDLDPEGDEDKDEAFDVGSELSVEDEAPAFEGTKTAGEQMREYVEKVTPKMGDTGTDGTKSPVAGKNDMGGSTANIAKGGTGSEKGSAMSAKEENAGNVNVPGGKASKSMSANAKGHGAEKKGAGETGTNSKSTIGS